MTPGDPHPCGDCGSVTSYSDLRDPAWRKRCKCGKDLCEPCADAHSNYECREAVMTESDEAERRREWIERTSAAFAGGELRAALVNLARAMNTAGVMTLDVKLRPFVSTSFPGWVDVTTSDPDMKQVIGRASVGAGERMKGRPTEAAGGINLVAVHGEDMGVCAERACDALIEEMSKRG